MSQVVCFWDKSRVQVSDDMGNKLKAAILAKTLDHFVLNGNLYSVKTVSQILSKDAAYEAFPDEWEYLGKMVDAKPSDETQKALLLSNSKLLN